MHAREMPRDGGLFSTVNNFQKLVYDQDKSGNHSGYASVKEKFSLRGEFIFSVFRLPAPMAQLRHPAKTQVIPVQSQVELRYVHFSKYSTPGISTVFGVERSPMIVPQRNLCDCRALDLHPDPLQNPQQDSQQANSRTAWGRL